MVPAKQGFWLLKDCPANLVACPSKDAANVSPSPGSSRRSAAKAEGEGRDEGGRSIFGSPVPQARHLCRTSANQNLKPRRGGIGLREKHWRQFVKLVSKTLRLCWPAQLI